MNNNYDFYDQPCENKSACGQPCSPDCACDECADYWQRMVDEGLWDKERHKWTDKGF